MLSSSFLRLILSIDASGKRGKGRYDDQAESIAKGLLYLLGRSGYRRWFGNTPMRGQWLPRSHKVIGSVRLCKLNPNLAPFCRNARVQVLRYSEPRGTNDASNYVIV